MIEYDLRAAHPAYHDLIVEEFERLLAKYPMTPLRRVVVYPPEQATNCKACLNRSLGDATTPGQIRLNGFWYSRSPEALRAAGEVEDEVPGYPGLRWHGGMPFPPANIFHEFGHCVDDIDKSLRDLSLLLWLEATASPENAPSGYALQDSDEFWAEAFALHELGMMDNPYVQEIGAALHPFQAK